MRLLSLVLSIYGDNNQRISTFDALAINADYVIELNNI
jgi:hypothetical protein